jgi:hypothetical protein
MTQSKKLTKREKIEKQSIENITPVLGNSILELTSISSDLCEVCDENELEIYNNSLQQLDEIYQKLSGHISLLYGEVIIKQ